MKLIIPLILILISTPSVASIVKTAKVKKILAGEVYGNVVFLKVEPKPESTPDCQKNPTFSYAFNPTTDVGQVTLSLVLTAYASQSEVYIDGYDICDNNSANVENLKQFELK